MRQRVVEQFRTRTIRPKIMGPREPFAPRSMFASTRCTRRRFAQSPKGDCWRLMAALGQTGASVTLDLTGKNAPHS
jgi:hypothetical protein